MPSAALHAFYLLASLLAALAFYCATPHQRLWPAGHGHARPLRWAGLAAGTAAVAAAIAALGTTAGVFSALTAWMMASVALPYFDAWRGLRRQR